MIAQRIAQGKMDSSEKLRLMMIASVALELLEKDRKSLTQSLPDNDKVTLKNLYWLGIDPAKVSSTKGKASEKSKTADKNKKGVSYDLCRYSPILETIANKAASNTLDKTDFGHIFVPNNYDGSIGQRSKITAGSASLKKGKSSNWNENMDERNQPKFIFFIIGGMSYSEIRVLHEFESQNAYLNVMAGSTSIMTPQLFIQSIEKMIPPND